MSRNGGRESVRIEAGTLNAPVVAEVNGMNRSSTRLVAAFSAILALAGCMGSEPRQANIPLAAMGPKPLPGTQTDGEAERFVQGATSCWLGGLWSDALSAPDGPHLDIGRASDARVADVERRCNAVLVHMYGAVDPIRYRQLRAVEPRVVDDLAARVRSVADNDRTDRPHAEELVKLLRTVADAERENVMARDEADAVKNDTVAVNPRRERATDKTLAAQALRRTGGVEALLSLDAGELSHEARAIGLLCALDRLEIARKLPEHLKVYAVGGPFAHVFGVQPPEVPADPTLPVKTGTWPGFLLDIAKASGHAIPTEATRPIDRESLAWGAVLQAFADRLRVEAGVLSTHAPLPLVLGRVADRLEQEDHNLIALFEAEKSARR
jgi:hypothetical protein